MEAVSTFFKRKDVVISAHRYGIDAMGAMAQGLFASLLIGTIIKTLASSWGLRSWSRRAAMRRLSLARPWRRPSVTHCTPRSWCCSA